MDFLNFTKNHLTRVPYPIGKVVSYLPYSYRPGLSTIYKNRKLDITRLENSSSNDLKKFIFEKMMSLVIHANKNVPFYRELYKRGNVSVGSFNEFSDLMELPIVNKNDLLQVDLDYRSVYKKGRTLVNTGGSSGKTLSMYIDSSSVAHEWAHMHHIWSTLGFKQSDLKVVFGGRSNVKNGIEYDSARHQISVDIYSGWDCIADRLYSCIKKFNPRYLHGYPSAIFDFILWLEETGHPLILLLKNNIKGLFLGSEFPSPQLRAHVERILHCGSVSWYGHTERTALAYEKDNKYTYSPFYSYGFTEAYLENKNVFSLVSSSYYNYVSPLIRYNTEDYIKPFVSGGLLRNFEVSKGRNGEFILDLNGNKVYLTALIFGRHHEIFNHARHVQIYQSKPGDAKFLITPKDKSVFSSIERYFDLSNVKLNFEFQVISAPYRSVSGKTPLLVKVLI